MGQKHNKVKSATFHSGDRIYMTHCIKCGKELSGDANFCPNCGTATRTVEETFSVSSDDLVQKVKELIHEGNVREIIIQNEEGKTLLEIPVTIGVIGIVLVPWLAAIGAIAALATKCTIVVRRQKEQIEKID